MFFYTEIVYNDSLYLTVPENSNVWRKKIETTKLRKKKGR